MIHISIDHTHSYSHHRYHNLTMTPRSQDMQAFFHASTFHIIYLCHLPSNFSSAQTPHASSSRSPRYSSPSQSTSSNIHRPTRYGAMTSIMNTNKSCQSSPHPAPQMPWQDKTVNKSPQPCFSTLRLFAPGKWQRESFLSSMATRYLSVLQSVSSFETSPRPWSLSSYIQSTSIISTLHGP